MDPTTVALLQRVHSSQPVTRRELAQQLGLSSSRINGLVNLLTDAHAICEKTARHAGLGRPAALLSVNPNAGRIIGLEVDGEWSRIVLTDMHGQVLHSLIRETQVVNDRAEIVGGMLRMIQAACTSAGILPTNLAGVGIAVGGLVDTDTGVVHDWPNVPAWADAWQGLDAQRELGAHLAVQPLCVDDTVRAQAQVAHRFGLARDSSDFLYLHLGSGVGAAVFVDGLPYLGRHGMAGELGHVTVDEDGPLCRCGNRGCLEIMAATWAVLRRVEERLAEARLTSALRAPFETGALSVNALIAAARNGDKLAFQVLDETGSYVGKVLAFALNLLGPELVVLGGPLTQDGGIILEAVQRQVRLHALQHIWRLTRIVCCGYNELAAAQGAALLAIDTIFRSPEYLGRVFGRAGQDGNQ